MIESVDYIRDTADALATMAKAQGFDELAYILAMAVLEAERLTDSRGRQKPH